MCKSTTVERWDAGHFLVQETPHAVADEIRRQLAAGALDTQRAGLALADLVALPARRAPHRPLLPRCWELPDDLTTYDATYVALAAETATDSVRTGLLTCTLVWPRRANPGSVRARGDEA
jgi:predicted nucleic acid-binding protein